MTWARTERVDDLLMALRWGSCPVSVWRRIGGTVLDAMQTVALCRTDLMRAAPCHFVARLRARRAPRGAAPTGGLGAAVEEEAARSRRSGLSTSRRGSRCGGPVPSSIPRFAPTCCSHDLHRAAMRAQTVAGKAQFATCSRWPCADSAAADGLGTDWPAAADRMMRARRANRCWLVADRVPCSRVARSSSVNEMGVAFRLA